MMRVKLKRGYEESAGRRYDLREDRIYVVLGIEADDYRIADEHGLPYLFPAEVFDVVDALRPKEWVVEFVDDAEYAYPPELNRTGFFEDYFDGDQEAIGTFQAYIRGLSRG